LQQAGGKCGSILFGSQESLLLPDFKPEKQKHPACAKKSTERPNEARALSSHCFGVVFCPCRRVVSQAEILWHACNRLGSEY
jgi:hypothetical protein